MHCLKLISATTGPLNSTGNKETERNWLKGAKASCDAAILLAHVAIGAWKIHATIVLIQLKTAGSCFSHAKWTE